MKQIYLIAIILIVLLTSGCDHDTVDPSKDCAYHAVVVDMTTLDGCGYMFRLDNGKYLQPVWRWGFCGTPPLPEGAEDDPLWNFRYEAGKQVMIGFEYTNEYANACMMGRTVIVTCLEPTGEEGAEY